MRATSAEVGAPGAPALVPVSPDPPHLGSGGDEADDCALIGTLRRTALALKQASLPFALGGSFAVHARGGPRPTHDVDFFVRPEDRDRAAAALQAAGLRVEQPALDWLFKAFDGDELADVIYAPVGNPVGMDLLDRADDLDVAALRMPVLSATDLMTFKMLTFSEHNCDFACALPTARALREQVDWAAVREAAARSPYAGAFLDLLGRLGVLDPSGRDAG
jgi:hypothetical protein